MAPMSWLGSSAALAILSFDVDAESAILAEGRQYAEHPSAMSHQRYGPLVGVPRILGLLEDLDRARHVLRPRLDGGALPGDRRADPRGRPRDRPPRPLAPQPAAHDRGRRAAGHRSRPRRTRPLRRQAARAIARRAGSRACARSTSSPSTASTTTHRSWTTTSRTRWRRRTGRSWSCRPTGASTTGTSTCTSPIRDRAPARCTRRRGRLACGRRSWTACAATVASSA